MALFAKPFAHLDDVPEEHTEAWAMAYVDVLEFLRDAAADIVINAGQGEGLEAWRLLCQRFEVTVHSSPPM